MNRHDNIAPPDRDTESVPLAPLDDGLKVEQLEVLGHGGTQMRAGSTSRSRQAKIPRETHLLGHGGRQVLAECRVHFAVVVEALVVEVDRVLREHSARHPVLEVEPAADVEALLPVWLLTL
eukprot:scaffold29086_cov101-Isochrysis_galbana.AAC.5